MLSLFILFILSFAGLSHFIERHGYKDYRKTYDALVKEKVRLAFKRDNIGETEYYFSNRSARFDNSFRKVSFIYNNKGKRSQIKLYGKDDYNTLNWNFVNFFNPYVLYWNIKLWNYFEKTKKY